MRFIFNLFGNYWYPVQYENYRDISWSKEGALSHTIVYFNVLTGKFKHKDYYAGGLLKPAGFTSLQVLAARRILAYFGSKFINSSTLNELKSVAEAKML